MDEQEALRNLAAADPRILVGAMALLTGDADVCAEIDTYLARGGSWSERGSADELAKRSFDVFAQHGWLRPDRDSLNATTRAEARRVMRLVTDPKLGDEYLEKFRHDLRLGGDSLPPPKTHWNPRLSVLVIGAGLSGLAMASRLEEIGADYTILEKHPDVGGVWFENSYPGCGLDTHPHVYDYSFAPKVDWPSLYAPRRQILNYLQDFAAENGIRARVRFRAEVRSAQYDASRNEWNVRTVDTETGATREYRARVLITAVGTLNQPKMPEIPSLDTFAGEVFHTARWRHDVDLEGKRIALIGNGSSGVQVAKALAELGELTVFQRSPAWIKPRRVNVDDETVSSEMHWLLENVPFYAALNRFSLYWENGDKVHSYLLDDPDWTGQGANEANERLRANLIDYIRTETGGDAELAQRVTPTYPPYVKRMVVDNDWYKTLRKPNVTFVTDRIARATDTGVVTAEGDHYCADVIVIGTGFKGTTFLYPMEVSGRSGRTPADIAGESDDARAYLGVTMPDFPNLFSIQGPNSSIGHGGAATFVAESQSHYIARILRVMNEDSLVQIECTQSACDSYNADLDNAMDRMVWTTDNVDSRYKNRAGRVVANHPWTLQQYWNMTRDVELADYHIVKEADDERQTSGDNP